MGVKFESHDVTITHASVYQWIKKYTWMMIKYVESNYPKIRPDVWSLDEMMLNEIHRENQQRIL